MGAVASTVFCIRVSRSLNERLAEAGAFESTTLYSFPAMVVPGDEVTADEIAAELRVSGFASGLGIAKHNSYQVSRDQLTVHQELGEAIQSSSIRIQFRAGRIAEIGDKGH